MTIEYEQLAQVRENSTNAVSIYSPAASKVVQAFLKICNTTAAVAAVRVFHDKNGTTYDETTALFWDTNINPGQTLEVDRIFMSDSTGNLAYRSDTANALTATVYGIIKS
jgi:hypothetical protein